MKLARTLEKVMLHPWLITPGGYAAVMRLIESKLAGEGLSVIAEKAAGVPIDKRVGNQNPEKIAQILISGVLGQRLSMMENLCGGCDYMDIAGAIDQAEANQAEGMLFVFDSPGGMALGCPECAARIASVKVPKIGYTDSMMTSGAYYLASGCDYLVATPSANVGSIGVIIPWIDKSKMWDNLGLEFAPIFSQGDSLKSTMYGPSLSDEQKEYLQEHVNDVARAFQAHVSQYRKLDFPALKAGSYTGQKALGLNLVDRIGLITDAYDELSKRISKTKA